MANENGTKSHTLWLQILGGTLVLVIGLIIGYYSSVAKAHTDFVEVDRYNIDQARLYHEIDQMNGKLDALLDRKDPLWRYKTGQ